MGLGLWIRGPARIIHNLAYQVKGPDIPSYG